MALLDLFKAVLSGERVVIPLISEKKLVHKKGKSFMETFHVKPNKGKLDIPKGTEVRYRPQGASYHRTGVVVGVGKDHYKIEGKRTSEGVVPVHKVPKVEVMTLTELARLAQQQQKKKLANTKITTEGDRTQAKHNLTGEELRRRKKIVEERLGFTENELIKHPSFVGPAINITSKLAKENGINTTVTGDNKKESWYRASDPDYQDMLYQYTQAAIKAWRRVLSKPITNDDKGKQLQNNIEQSKQVIAGKEWSSYAHLAMQEEGRAAVIHYLEKRREDRDLFDGQDIHDMAEDPNARQILESTSTQPMQIPFTMAANKEALVDDLKLVLRDLEPVERDVLKASFGLHPYEEPVKSNRNLADMLNERHIKAPGIKRWNRDNVGQLIARIIKKIRQSPTMEALSFHNDVSYGRELHAATVWKSQRLPADYHPEGDYIAAGINYTIAHEGKDAVLVKAEKGGVAIEGATF